LIIVPVIYFMIYGNRRTIDSQTASTKD
jgi:hypothetical protein